jgi:hypothetical protein
MSISENVIKKKGELNTLDNYQSTANLIAIQISEFLSDEIDELNVYSHIFKSGLERSLLRVLNALEKQPQSVVIFPDSIPGFTMMVFRREVKTLENTVKPKKRNPTEEIKEYQALDLVINRFFSKNQQKVIVVETNDMLFGLFPVSDTRKNLKEMELYITF